MAPEWIGVFCFVAGTTVVACIARWLMYRPRYHVVSVWKTRTLVTTFRNKTKAEKLFHSLSQSLSPNLYRVVMTREEAGSTEPVWGDDRLDKLLDKPKEGGLTGEAKILTFPKRKGET